MAFGKNRAKQVQSSQVNQSQNQPSTEEFVYVEEIIRQIRDIPEECVSGDRVPSENNKKTLFDEVTMVVGEKWKNLGGTKRWTCNHCKKSYSSSYIRIHQHFFGPLVGKKAEIGRCTMMLSNRELLKSIRNKVEEAEHAGISPSLTKSTFKCKIPGFNSTPIGNAITTVERHQVDIAIVHFLYANGVSFNVIRSPEFASMAKALNHAPKDYKPLSADRASTSLLEEVKRDVEKELAPIKDTRETQGASIISDGWTNVKNQPLINVVASNNCGNVLLYAENFSGVEKTGKGIASFLLTLKEEVGASNVLQVATENAAKCKVAGKKIEKVPFQELRT